MCVLKLHLKCLCLCVCACVSVEAVVETVLKLSASACVYVSACACVYVSACVVKMRRKVKFFFSCEHFFHLGRFLEQFVNNTVFNL